MKVEFSVNSELAGILSKEVFEVNSKDEMFCNLYTFENFCELQKLRHPDETFFVEVYQVDGEMSDFRSWLKYAESNV